MSQIFTAADLNTYARKTLDPGLAAQVVLSTNQYIERETSRCWGETKQVTERYDFNGATLWLRNMDIVSIDSVQLGWPGFTQSTLPSTAYFFEPAGRMVLLGYLLTSGNASPRWNSYFNITYTYGQTTIPEDLRNAALGFALSFYNWAYAGGHEVTESQAGSYHVKYINSVRGAQTTDGPTPYNNVGEANWMIIKGYAMPKF